MQRCLALAVPCVSVDPQLQQPLEALDMAILGSKMDWVETWQQRGINAVWSDYEPFKARPESLSTGILA